MYPKFTAHVKNFSQCSNKANCDYMSWPLFQFRTQNSQRRHMWHRYLTIHVLVLFINLIQTLSSPHLQMSEPSRSSAGTVSGEELDMSLWLSRIPYHFRGLHHPRSLHIQPASYCRPPWEFYAQWSLYCFCLLLGKNILLQWMIELRNAILLTHVVQRV